MKGVFTKKGNGLGSKKDNQGMIPVYTTKQILQMGNKTNNNSNTNISSNPNNSKSKIIANTKQLQNQYNQQQQ